MTVDSKVHRIVTLGLFALVAAALYLSSFFAFGDGWSGVVRLVVIIAVAFGISAVFDIVRRAVRAR